MITLTRPVWYAWYYPLPSYDVGSMSPHQRPPFLFKKKKEKEKDKDRGTTNFNIYKNLINKLLHFLLNTNQKSDLRN